VLPPSYGAASGLLFSRGREARRFSPKPFVVFVILVVLLVLMLLLLAYLIARRWLR
jgi:hypothetical protein